jgi:hypothetical protein
MFLTMKFFSPVVLLFAILVACGDPSDRPGAVGDDTTSPVVNTAAPQQTETLPDPPFVIEGPFAAAEFPAALDGVPFGSERLILDDALTTGWIVRPALLDIESHRHADIRLAWLDDGRLGIATIGGEYTWKPGSTIEPADVVVPTPTPRPEIIVSSDGAWYARGEPSEIYFDTLVGRTGALPTFRLTLTIGGEWSPVDPSQLLVLGSPCVSSLIDLFLFDTDEGSLGSLTAALPDDVSLFLLNFAWHPDGKRVAIETWGKSGEASRLVTVDVDTGDVDSIALAKSAAPVPIAWSPGGELLLVRFEGAHGGLFCEQRTDWAPSSVERLTP